MRNAAPAVKGRGGNLRLPSGLQAAIFAGMKPFFRFAQIVIATAAWNLSSLAAPVELVPQPPAKIAVLDGGVTLVDFGRVAFGNIVINAPDGAMGEITVRFGEAMKDGRVDRKPGGTIRFSEVKVALKPGENIVAPPADKRNTTKPAVLTPKEFGVITPFRWVEIEGWSGALTNKQITRRAAFAKGWDDNAASFKCSDETLNRIWDLCQYSIKATTFAGVFVDGDRERIPYEADAYLNQLSYYACSTDMQMPRDTFDFLMKAPTWPSEWAPHMIFMARADWNRTGDADWLAARYESLKPKLQLDRARADGLLTSNEAQVKRNDIVDWPVGERDGYQFKPVNTVVNAFHIRALSDMAWLAGWIGKKDDERAYGEQLEKKRVAFNAVFLNAATGLYVDGEGSDHSSLHANLFPLAFGLVPEANKPKVVEFLKKKGMACSVYAAQYLLEGLFEAGEGDAAIGLILAKGDRSWRHMVDSGTTITWEAWDNKYKPNQDWNHAWGAAPANLLPRYVLGVTQSASVNFGIAPRPGIVKSAEGTVPTKFGPLTVKWSLDSTFKLSANIPKQIGAGISLPFVGKGEVTVNGKPVKCSRNGNRLYPSDGEWSGKLEFEVK